MADLMQPTEVGGVVEAMREARAAGRPLRIEGGGSKAAFGRPAQAAATLSLKQLSGITLYEPGELVISALAGTPVEEVEAALAEKGQHLPFEPPDWRALFGTTGTRPTLGGIVAANLSGPRRLTAGAARDFVIGVKAVNGLGELVTSGGRVMKNVTGYDLSKLLSGAHGTLGVLTEITLKVLPAPEAEITLLLGGLDEESGRRAMSAALGTPYQVTAAAHLPAPAAHAAGAGNRPATLLRLEGFQASVAYRAEALAGALEEHGTAARIDTVPSAALWQAVREVSLFSGERDRPLWRLSVAPTDGPGVVARITETVPARVLYDWGGGLVWLAPDGTDAQAHAVRAAVDAVGGHATLMRAPETVRAAIPVFQPRPAAIAALDARIKHAFDPDRVLNPGRMHADL